METIKYESVDPNGFSSEDLEGLRRLESASHADTLQFEGQPLSTAQVGAIVSDNDKQEYYDNLKDRNSAVGVRLNPNQEHINQVTALAIGSDETVVGFAQAAVNISGGSIERLGKRLMHWALTSVNTHIKPLERFKEKFLKKGVYVNLIRNYVLPDVLDYDPESASIPKDEHDSDDDWLIQSKKELLKLRVKLELIEQVLARFENKRYKYSPVKTYLWSIDPTDEIELYELLGFMNVEETTKNLLHDGTLVKQFTYRADSVSTVIKMAHDAKEQIKAEVTKLRD